MHEHHGGLTGLARQQAVHLDELQVNNCHLTSQSAKLPFSLRFLMYKSTGLSHLSLAVLALLADIVNLYQMSTDVQCTFELGTIQCTVCTSRNAK